MHGGTTPRGMANPSTKHGKFSKDLPTHLIADYQAALIDPDLVALREEMALLQAREAELVRSMSRGEARERWEAAQEAMAAFQSARRSDNVTAMAAALKSLDQVLQDGAADYDAWADLLLTIEQRRKLADTERRRLEAIQDRISADRALLLASALVNAVRRNVTDRRVLAAIELDFQLVLRRGSDAPGDQPGVAA